MAATISCGFPWLCDGATLNGLLTRTNDVAASMLSTGTATAVAVRGGVLPAAGAEPLLVSASTGMQVTVNAGSAVVPSSTSSTYGAYRMSLMSQGTVTIATADAANARIDLIVAQVVDNGDATSVSQIAVLTGTPAPTPAAPSTTGMHVVVLAQISVAANVSSIVAGNITDKRQFTTAAGAPLLVTSQAQRDAITAPFDGMKVYRRDTGNEEIYKKASNAWGIVGTVIDSGWINFTFSSGWATGQIQAVYRKIQVGPQPRVYLRGLIAASGGGGVQFSITSAVTPVTLPAGYRPTYDTIVPGATSSTSQPACQVYITASNGNITFQGPQTSITALCLDGISFEQSN